MKLSLNRKFIVRRSAEGGDLACRSTVPDPAEHHWRHKGRFEVSKSVLSISSYHVLESLSLLLSQVISVRGKEQHGREESQDQAHG